jgi:hypothetical protein
MFDAVQQNDKLGFGSFQQLATWAVEEEKRVSLFFSHHSRILHNI